MYRIFFSWAIIFVLSYPSKIAGKKSLLIYSILTFECNPITVKSISLVILKKRKNMYIIKTGLWPVTVACLINVA